MNTFNGAVCATNAPYGDSSSTTYSYYLSANGDTLRLCQTKTPATSSATGYPGEICWDTNYIYVCTASNTWKRSALSSF